MIFNMFSFAKKLFLNHINQDRLQHMIGENPSLFLHFKSEVELGFFTQVETMKI